MNSIVVIVGVVVGVIVLFRVKAGFGKYKAAMNALLAKHTFQSLDAATQRKVVDQTKSILGAGGIDGEARESRLEERERYGFYALAMSELGIPPELDGYDWQFVRNPFVALLRAEKEIQAAQRQLRKANGVHVDI